MPIIIIQKSPEWPRNNTLKSFTHKSIFFTKRYLNLKNYGVNFMARTLYEKKHFSVWFTADNRMNSKKIKAQSKN